MDSKRGILGTSRSSAHYFLTVKAVEHRFGGTIINMGSLAGLWFPFLLS
jgi:hypothetical protein